MSKAVYKHLTDVELLRFADRELPARLADEASRHLAECALCRTRLTSFQAASEDYLDIHNAQTEMFATSSVDSRTALKAAITRGHGQRPAFGSSSLAARLSWAACLIFILMAGSVWSFQRLALRRSARSLQRELAFGLPVESITPGAKRAITIAELCNAAIENDPPVKPSIEEAVFREYGLSKSSASRNYQLDYLISPALGGTRDISNLWPQPSSTPWNAEKKDKLEDHLHELVCKGDLPLAVAQEDISKDWIAAYHRYFSTPG